jgi:hypothetical protein
MNAWKVHTINYQDAIGGFKEWWGTEKIRITAAVMLVYAKNGASPWKVLPAGLNLIV